MNRECFSSVIKSRQCQHFPRGPSKYGHAVRFVSQELARRFHHEWAATGRGAWHPSWVPLWSWTLFPCPSYLALTCSVFVACGVHDLDFSGFDFRECSLFVVCLLPQRIKVHASDYGGWFAGDDIYAVFPSLSSGPGCAASCAA